MRIWLTFLISLVVALNVSDHGYCEPIKNKDCTQPETCEGALKKQRADPKLNRLK